MPGSIETRVAAEIGHRVAHRGEVDDRGHAGEVLHEHARGHELQLADTGLGRGTRPVGERADVVGVDVRAVLVAQQVLEQDAQRIRERVRIVDHLVEPVEVVRAVADGEAGAGTEAVEGHERKLPAYRPPLCSLGFARGLARPHG